MLSKYQGRFDRWSNECSSCFMMDVQLDNYLQTSTKEISDQYFSKLSVKTATTYQHLQRSNIVGFIMACFGLWVHFPELKCYFSDMRILYNFSSQSEYVCLPKDFLPSCDQKPNSGSFKNRFIFQTQCITMYCYIENIE